MVKMSVDTCAEGPSDGVDGQTVEFVLNFRGKMPKFAC